MKRLTFNDEVMGGIESIDKHREFDTKLPYYKSSTNYFKEENNIKGQNFLLI